MLLEQDKKGGVNSQKEFHSGTDHQQAKGGEGSLKTKTMAIVYWEHLALLEFFRGGICYLSNQY